MQGTLTHDPDQKVLDEVTMQLQLNSVTERLIQNLASLPTSERSWVMGQLAERFCPLCGRARERREDGRLKMCTHGDGS
jgi:NADH pyrophosphatase NudC (nudix superfamily)